jgi:hypothetical protein
VARLSGNAGLAFSWTAPAGNPASYQLKYFNGKPLADYPDFDYANFDTTKLPWWFANNVEGEPRPSGQGSPESFAVTGSFSTDSVYYAAVCSRDSAGNLSRLSNLVRIDNTVAVEEWAPGDAPLSWCVYPVPFNPSVTLRINLPKAGVQPKVSVFNAAGRLVWKAEPRATTGRTLTVVWNGKNMAGQATGSGVYFVRLTVGGKELNRKIVMVR